MVKINEWKKMAAEFQEHFPSSEVETDSEKLLFQDSSATLEITSEGAVKAEMPLHSFDTENIEEVEFDDDSVLINGDEFAYRFRK